MSRVVDDAALSLVEPAELVKKHGLRFARFRSVHLAQCRPGAAPVQLFRGQPLTAQSDMDSRDELQAMADAFAIHLANTVSKASGSEGIVAYGTRTLATGEAEGGDNGARVAALVHLALDRYLALPVNQGERTVVARRRAAESSQISTRSFDVNLPLDMLDELDLAPAFALLNSTKSTSGWSDAAWSTTQREWTKNAFVPGATPALRGMIAAAYSTRKDNPEAENVIREAFRTETPATLASTMPWLGLADTHALTDQPRTPPSATALREMRSLIWKHQLNALDAGDDGPDLVGGILIPDAKNPLPTAQSARLVCFLATMLRDPVLTPERERPGEIVRLLAAMRFLRQLQADETVGWMAKEPALVRGGLRNATWDQRTNPEASAMALLACVELLKSLDSIAPPTPKIEAQPPSK